MQIDINQAMGYYYGISEALGDGFWDELQQFLAAIEANPEGFHFDTSGLRRCNLNRFPYNILFEILADRIRVQVVRHHSRRPSFGLRRKWK